MNDPGWIQLRHWAQNVRAKNGGKVYGTPPRDGLYPSEREALFPAVVVAGSLLGCGLLILLAWVVR